MLAEAALSPHPGPRHPHQGRASRPRVPGSLPRPRPTGHPANRVLHSGVAGTELQTDTHGKAQNVRCNLHGFFLFIKKIFISLNIDLEKNKKGQSHKIKKQLFVTHAFPFTPPERTGSSPSCKQGTCRRLAGGGSAGREAGPRVSSPVLVARERTALRHGRQTPRRSPGAVSRSEGAGRPECGGRWPGHGRGSLRGGASTKPRATCWQQRSGFQTCFVRSRSVQKVGEVPVLRAQVGAWPGLTGDRREACPEAPPGPARPPKGERAGRRARQVRDDPGPVW